MTHRQMFSILSSHASLVEVVGDGPASDLRDGLTVPDGTVTIAPVHLHDRSVRRWRVDADPQVRTSVVVTDSPYGAFVGVRRCFPTTRPTPCGLFSLQRWPQLRQALKRRTSSLGVLCSPFADHAQPRAWEDADDGASHQVLARGGDIVTVTFVVVREERSHA